MEPPFEDEPGSAEAIGHLEVLRRKGGTYLLFPRTAFWWFDHYAEFQSHLEASYRRIWSDQDCIIYALSEQGPNERAQRSVRRSSTRIK